MADQNFIRFRPGDFVAGGGIPDGVYRVASSEYVPFDYDGNIKDPVTALGWGLVPQTVSGSGAAAQYKDADDKLMQHYSVGPMTKFAPSEDKHHLVRTGEQTGPGKNSNFFILITSLINAGFPEDKIDADCSVFEGMIAEFKNIAQPKRSGLPQSNLVKTDQASDRDRTIPVPVVIARLPWDKKATVAAKSKAAATTAAATTSEAPTESNGASDIETVFAEIIADVLKGEKGEVPRAKLRLNVFKEANRRKLDAATRDALTKMVADDDQLGLAAMGANFVVSKDSVAPA